MTKTHFRSTLALAAALAAAISFPASVFAQQTHDRYIVQFLPGGGAAGSAAVRAAGGQVVLELGRHDAVAVRLPAAALPGLTRNTPMSNTSSSIQSAIPWRNRPPLTGSPWSKPTCSMTARQQTEGSASSIRATAWITKTSAMLLM